jgi:hypothetical protein
MEGAARDPNEWRAPFAWRGDDAGVLHDLGGGHRVRAQADADLGLRVDADVDSTTVDPA